MSRVWWIALVLVACSAPPPASSDLAVGADPDLAAPTPDLGEEDAAVPDLAQQEPADLAGPVDLGPPVGGLTLMAAGSTTLTAVGATVQLSATAVDFDGGTLSGTAISWRSDSTAIATVNGTGRVTAVGNGTTLIHATAGPNQAEATIAITVTIAVASVTVAPTTARIADGKSATLVATARDSASGAIGGVTFTWTSGDATHAAVSSTGVVTGSLAGAFGLGPITITASAEGKDGTAQISIAVYKTWSFVTGNDGLTVDVTQNQYLVLKNPDGATHSVVLDGDSSVVVGNFGAGDSPAKQITLPPGSYPFHCGVHGAAMVGTLVVH